MSPEIEKLAKSQDEIGFKNFTEGRISKHFQEIQQRRLEYAESFMNGKDWVKRSIAKLDIANHAFAVDLSKFHSARQERGRTPATGDQADEGGSASIVKD